MISRIVITEHDTDRRPHFTLAVVSERSEVFAWGPLLRNGRHVDSIGDAIDVARERISNDIADCADIQIRNYDTGEWRDGGAL